MFLDINPRNNFYDMTQFWSHTAASKQTDWINYVMKGQVADNFAQ